MREFAVRAHHRSRHWFVSDRGIRVSGRQSWRSRDRICRTESEAEGIRTGGRSERDPSTTIRNRRAASPAPQAPTQERVPWDAAPLGNLSASVERFTYMVAQDRALTG